MTTESAKAQTEHSAGFAPPTAMEEATDKRLDEIEMIGEESALGFPKPSASTIDPNLRFLHSSRTIHQLITDRNRAVGIYLGVASLMWTASGAILNAKPNADLMVPISSIQRWCLPVTFGTLSILALFTGLLLIRTRIGLIYEVAKMNVLLGLPVGRVQRVNPLSIFFIMHFIISAAGGTCFTLFAYHIAKLADPFGPGHMIWCSLVGIGFAAFLVAAYVRVVLQTTTDGKLQQSARL